MPGDIVNLIDPPLSILPADMFLLSGDAIVNESMLTGESVPVGKIPVKDTDLAHYKDDKDISGDSAKSFLYSGTRVVRVRGALAADGTMRAPALGLVVRTGKPCVQPSPSVYSPLGRIQHYQGCAGPVDALSQACGLQVLSGFHTIHSGSDWNRWFGLLRERRPVRQARGKWSHLMFAALDRW